MRVWRTSNEVQGWTEGWHAKLVWQSRKLGIGWEEDWKCICTLGQTPLSFRKLRSVQASSSKRKYLRWVETKCNVLHLHTFSCFCPSYCFLSHTVPPWTFEQSRCNKNTKMHSIHLCNYTRKYTCFLKQKRARLSIRAEVLFMSQK